MQEMRRELAERQIREWLDRKWNVSMFFPNEGEEERFRDICAGTPALLSITALRGDLPGRLQHSGGKNGRSLLLGAVRQVPVRHGSAAAPAGRTRRARPARRPP